MIDIAALMPTDTPDYMAPAWFGCVSWALDSDEVVAAFRADTGNRWQPGRTGIERAIDEATGADEAFIVAFIEWVNVYVWGPIDAPQGCDRE